MNIFDKLLEQTKTTGVNASMLISVGISRSTAYAFLRGEPKNYSLNTLTKVENAIQKHVRGEL